MRADVGDRKHMLRAADEAEAKFGFVNLLCNNAGVGVTAPIASATFRDWDYAMRVNVGGVINGVQVFLPRMLAAKAPAHIVTTCSMSGLFHGGEAGVYTTTKFAVVGMMEALRAEMSRHRIGVSVFCPGLVRSRIFLQDRNRPKRFDGPGPGAKPRPKDPTTREALLAAGMDPVECARKVLAGVCRNDMFILTHPEFKEGLRDRCDALMASIDVYADTAVPPERVQAEQRVLRHQVYASEVGRHAISHSGDVDGVGADKEA
jgi:NAD(P)-dependent dehydrogenase (short-subunit alcohol dehydrogenase family)